MVWTKPSYASHNCGMEVNMYAPDEPGEVLFRTARLERAEESRRCEPERRELERGANVTGQPSPCAS